MLTVAVFKNRARRAGKVLAVFLLLYIFLVSISLMSQAFKGFGSGFAEYLIKTTSNPFIGLFVGLLATSIIQSSSTTTSMVVAFVASGTLSVQNAIPIVMGANIGTTVTNTLVAIGHITRREEFKRALSCSTVHDLFNLMTAFILLPIEITTGFLEKSASFLAGKFCNVSAVCLQSPLKLIIKPAVSYIDTFFTGLIGAQGKLASGVMLIFAVILLFTSLIFIVKVMKTIVLKQTEAVLDKILGSNALFVMFMGMLFTAIVQSSSVTTSILVPLVASGILSVENAFPVTLGANLGTTVTAILASLAGNTAGITIAFAHLLFNITGILIFYPVPALRKIPVLLGKVIGEMAYKKRRYAFAYVSTIFFIIPAILIFISRNMNW